MGAILTQNTSWTNVEKAIKNLKRKHLMNARSIFDIKSSKLEGLIRPSGYYRQKSRKLKAFVSHLYYKYNGSLRKMLNKRIDELRDELLSLHGIGEETADSIVLYAAKKPSFVVDAYARRIGHRLGWFKFNEYGKIKRYFEENLPKSVRVYNEFHALLVELGKRSCRKEPDCPDCLLKKAGVRCDR
jgi:endonuclease-3 related protein